MNSIEEKVLAHRTPGKKRSTRNPAHLLAAYAVDAVLEKKAHDVAVMDMRTVSSVADFFVVCTGDSDLQIKAIVEEVRGRIREALDERPWHVEGDDHRQWVLIDYVDLVVHVFSREKREFYDLERLWGDAPVEEVPEDKSSEDVRILQQAAAEKPPTEESEQHKKEE